MALAVHAAVVLPDVRRVPSWLGSAVALTLCTMGVALLASPALAVGSAAPPASPVSVRLLGELSTAGLPETPAVSRLSVLNDGATPVSWSARSSLSGAGAGGVRIETWVSTDSRCGAPTRLLTATDWSEEPLPPGGSTDLCVRVIAVGTSAGLVTPSLTVAARPTGS